MRETVQLHEARSQAVADSLRTLLIALNTGGIGVVLATASAFASKGVKPNWAVPPVSAFIIGLVLVAISLLLQKVKALRRREAAAEAQVEPNYDTFFGRNYTWDIAALVAFVVGSVLGLVALSCLVPVAVG